MRTQREEVSSPSEGETLVGSRDVGNPVETSYLITLRAGFYFDNFRIARHSLSGKSLLHGSRLVVSWG